MSWNTIDVMLDNCAAVCVWVLLLVFVSCCAWLCLYVLVVVWFVLSRIELYQIVSIERADCR